jgi:hypothetical protein
MFSEEYNLYFLEKIKCPKTEEEYDNRDIFKDKIKKIGDIIKSKRIWYTGREEFLVHIENLEALDNKEEEEDIKFSAKKDEFIVIKSKMQIKSIS